MNESNDATPGVVQQSVSSSSSTAAPNSAPASTHSIDADVLEGEWRAALATQVQHAREAATATRRAAAAAQGSAHLRARVAARTHPPPPLSMPVAPNRHRVPAPGPATAARMRTGERVTAARTRQQLLRRRLAANALVRPPSSAQDNSNGSTTTLRAGAAGAGRTRGNFLSNIGNQITGWFDNITGISQLQNEVDAALNQITSLSNHVGDKIIQAQTQFALSSLITAGEQQYGGVMTVTGQSTGNGNKKQQSKTSKTIDKKLSIEIFDVGMRTAGFFLGTLVLLAGTAYLVYLLKRAGG